MKDLFLIAVLFGGFLFAALLAFGMSVAPHYWGHRILTLAAALSALSFSALGSRTLALVVIMTSFVMSLPPLIGSPKGSQLRRPIAPVLVLVAANAWNTYAIFKVTDPAFMGGNC